MCLGGQEAKVQCFLVVLIHLSVSLEIVKCAVIICIFIMKLCTCVAGCRSSPVLWFLPSVGECLGGWIHEFQFKVFQRNSTGCSSRAVVFWDRVAYIHYPGNVIRNNCIFSNIPDSREKVSKLFLRRDIWYVIGRLCKLSVSWASYVMCRVELTICFLRYVTHKERLSYATMISYRCLIISYIFLISSAVLLSLQTVTASACLVYCEMFKLIKMQDANLLINSLNGIAWGCLIQMLKRGLGAYNGGWEQLKRQVNPGSRLKQRAKIMRKGQDLMRTLMLFWFFRNQIIHFMRFP